jgi:hypothetical protein
MPVPVLQSAVSSVMMNGHSTTDMDTLESSLDSEDDFLVPGQMPLPKLAARINAKLQRFLSQQPKDEQMGNTQKQTKISLDVIKEALHRYE